MSILTNRPRPVSLIILLYYIILYYIILYYIILYYIILYYIILYYIILYYTSWHKFWHLNPSVGRGSLLAKYFLPCCCICDSSLIWYATGPCSEQVEFWPLDPKGWVGGGVCRQNICYHFAALVIYLNLICNMFMFWKSCILTLRPPVLAGGGGGGGLLAKYSLLCCCMCDSF